MVLPRRPAPRYAAYRVLVNILYGQYPFFGWVQDYLIVSQPRRWARLLSLETRRLRAHLSWLEEKGFLSNLDTRSEYWSFQVTPNQTSILSENLSERLK